MASMLSVTCPRFPAYLGHAHVTDTYWYLTATPELLRYALLRMEQSEQEHQIHELTPQRFPVSWRPSSLTVSCDNERWLPHPRELPRYVSSAAGVTHNER